MSTPTETRSGRPYDYDVHMRHAREHLDSANSEIAKAKAIKLGKTGRIWARIDQGFHLVNAGVYRVMAINEKRLSHAKQARHLTEQGFYSDKMQLSDEPLSSEARKGVP